MGGSTKFGWLTFQILTPNFTNFRLNDFATIPLRSGKSYLARDPRARGRLPRGPNSQVENSKVSDPATAFKQGAMEPPEDEGKENVPSKTLGTQPADSGQAKAEPAVAVATGKPEAAAAVATAASAIDAIRRLPSGPGVEPEELSTTQTQNFAVEATPEGCISESPGHGQVDNDVALTVSQSSATNKRLWSAKAITASDREVQNLFAVKERGTKLQPSQNSTPQRFVYNSSVPSRAQSRTSAGSQNNELVELMTKFVADNRDEMFRREQQAAEQAREKTRLEMELAILQTQLQYATSGLVRGTAGSDFLSGTAATVFQGGSEEAPPFGLTHTAATVGLLIRILSVMRLLLWASIECQHSKRLVRQD